jgi:flagellar hook-associated protein 1 FlgK
VSINSILNTAASGLATAQTQISVVSDNVTNVDTPGYIKEVANQVATSTAGVGTGVDIASVQLASNSFLEAASRQATSTSASVDAQSQYFDQLQSLFGDPSSSSSFFNQISSAFASFSSVAENPTSTPYLQQSVSAVQQVFSQASTIATGIQQVRGAADSQIGADVNTVNSLLSQIEALNNQMSQSGVQGQNVFGEANTQQQLVNQLSTLMNITVTPRTGGGVTVRTTNGSLLAGDGAATLSYQPTGTVSAQTQFNNIILTSPGSTPQSLEPQITSGEIAGLLQLRDVQAPSVAAQLSELTTQTANALNVASNASTTAPPPATLTGQTIGLDLPSAISGFTGTTNVVLTNSSGVIQHQLQINFTNGTMSLDGGSNVGFNSGTFLSTLNATLGALGSASFTNNQLSLSAASGGVAVVDDPTTPSNSGGSGFSAYFGLNDIVTSTALTNYHTGLNPNSTSQFGAGGQIGLQLASGPGTAPVNVTVPIPAGGTITTVLDALNDPTTGLGRYGTFSLDNTGQMTFAASSTPAPTLNVTSDTTSWAGGPSLSQIFGVGQGVQTARAGTFSVASGLQQNPNGVPIASVNLAAASAVPSTPAVVSGDGTGAQAMADAGQANLAFSAAGGNTGGTSTVTTYASNLSGTIGQQAQSLTTQKTNSDSLQTAAQSRLSSVEGVNLDQELTNLTTYQQAYSASSRLVQAAIDMFTALIAVVP